MDKKIITIIHHVPAKPLLLPHTMEPPSVEVRFVNLSNSGRLSAFTI